MKLDCYITPNELRLLENLLLPLAYPGDHHSDDYPDGITEEQEEKAAQELLKKLKIR